MAVVQNFPAGSVTVAPSGSIFIDGPEGVNAYRLLVIRRGLKMKAETGMNLSRFSCIKAAAEYGVKGKTAKTAYRELNAMMVEAGFDDLGALEL